MFKKMQEVHLVIGPPDSLARTRRYLFIFPLATAFSTATSAAAQYTLSDGAQVAELEVFQECDVCPEMIVLPMGSFLMGAPRDEAQDITFTIVGVTATITNSNEQPVHPVEIDIPFALSENEITYDQWMACVHDGGCNGHIPRHTVLLFPDSEVQLGGSHPVMDVSYEDAMAYAAWLNEQVGADVYRLPTEAEWEYAARAGTQTPFAQGHTLVPSMANINFFDDKNPSPLIPVPVDELNAGNDWGLRHMSGNVREITASCISDEQRGLELSSQYVLEAEQPNCDRVTRGGDYRSGIRFARVASRGGGFQQTSRTRGLGFRILRELEIQQEVAWAVQ